MTSQLLHMLVALTILGLVAMVGNGAEPSAEHSRNSRMPALGFDLSTVPEPDPERGKPIARALDEYLYASSEERIDVGMPDPLVLFVWTALKRQYIKQYKLTATAEEIDLYIRALDLDEVPASDRRLSEEDMAIVRLEIRKGAKAAIEAWKMDKMLYEQYGGEVVFQQLNPREPIGAYRAFLEEMENAKVFEVFNDEDRDRLWKHLQRRGNREVSAKDVDFSVPWWLLQRRK